MIRIWPARCLHTTGTGIRQNQKRGCKIFKYFWQRTNDFAGRGP